MTSMETPQIKFGFTQRTPVIRQTEAAECGLACLAMLLNHYGHRCDLASLRNRFPLSLQGATFSDLMTIGGEAGLLSRALALDLDELQNLRLPCVLHWNFKHFVVLTKITGRYLEISDPADGRRRIPWQEASRLFTGVAMEFWPGTDFTLSAAPPKLPLRRLIGTIHGLVPAGAQILFLAMLLECATLASPLFMQWVMDTVLVSQDQTLLMSLAIGFGLLLIFQNLVTVLRSWALMYFNATINLQWRANIFAHLIRLPVGYFEKRSLGDVLSRFGSVEQIQKVLSSSFVEGIIDGLFGCITLVVMYLYSPLLASVTVAAVGTYIILRLALYSKLEQATHDFIVNCASQEGHLIETLRGIRALKLFQREPQRKAQWIKHFGDQVNADVGIQKINIVFRSANGLIFGLETLAVIAIGADMVINKRFTAGALVAFLSFRGQFVGRFLSLIEKLLELRLLSIHSERLGDIALSEREDGPLAARGNAGVRNDIPDIEFSAVSFRYGSNTAYIFGDLNLTIRGGESVAVVGPSGCGKSTLIQILLGIYRPTEGEVRIDGEPIEKLGLANLRKYIGVVMQDDHLFSGTVLDNICFFDEAPDHDWARECARMACVAGEIEAMPMAYNTLVGDMGSVLSGGQKQRVLIARALYKKPKILILDEATSHLDVENEKKVNEAICGLNITRILIAHRPETIFSAGRIITLGHGMVVGDTSRNIVSQASEENTLAAAMVN